MRKHIRRITSAELVPALELVWTVFSVFEAPEYSAEGIAEFRRFIEPDNILSKMQSGGMVLWGWYEGTQCAGVIAVSVTGHIHLLFVGSAYQRRGIATALFQAAERFFDERQVTNVTVNSSPYAVEVYRRFGFHKTGEEQTVHGIRFTPMALCKAVKDAD